MRNFSPFQPLKKRFAKRILAVLSKETTRDHLNANKHRARTSPRMSSLTVLELLVAIFNGVFFVSEVDVIPH